MKLLDHKSNAEIKEKEDFSSLLNTVDTILADTNSKPLTQIPSYFYQNEDKKVALNKGFLMRVTLLIQKIKSIFYTVKNAFGPFRMTKADFQKESLFRTLKTEITTEKNALSASNLDKMANTMVNSMILEKSITPQILDVSQEKKHVIAAKSPVVAKAVVPTQKSVEIKAQPILVTEPVTYIEKVFASLPSLKDVFSQYSSTITTYFQSLAEKKPRKIASFKSVVDTYEESFIKIYDLQQAITSVKQLYPKVKRQEGVSEIHSLEPLYFSQLLSHTVAAQFTEDQETHQTLKKSELSSIATLELLNELKTVFLTFSPNILSKTYTELLAKAEYIYDEPSTKKLKPVEHQSLELSVQSQNVSFQTLKRYTALEIQQTVTGDITTLNEFNKGRETIWNWKKTNQAESIAETTQLFEYGLLYLKTVTEINKRYIEILKSHLRNLKNIEKLEKNIKNASKKVN